MDRKVAESFRRPNIAERPFRGLLVPGDWGGRLVGFQDGGRALDCPRGPVDRLFDHAQNRNLGNLSLLCTLIWGIWLGPVSTLAMSGERQAIAKSPLTIPLQRGAPLRLLKDSQNKTKFLDRFCRRTTRVRVIRAFWVTQNLKATRGFTYNGLKRLG